MKRWISLAAAVLALAATPAVATASQDSVHFGPINSGSTDSGTCGNDWANDTYKRVFDASTTPSGGTYTVTERFIAGRFVTMEGASPGACEISPFPGVGTIKAGVTGSFHGNFLIVVSGGTFSPDATCDASSCGTTAAFVATVYGEAATYNVPSFGFSYHANGPGLIDRKWRNASADQGGNSGDIRST